MVSASYRKRHPDKVRARRIVYKMRYEGKLTKKPCFCGSKKVEAHHDDYTKPLEIVWLCKRHHEEIHGR